MNWNRISYFMLIGFLLAGPFLGATPAQEEQGGHREIAQDRIFKFERLDVDVDDFKAQGFILETGWFFLELRKEQSSKGDLA